MDARRYNLSVLGSVAGCQRSVGPGHDAVRDRRAVTIVELLVAIGILALLASVLLPAVQQVRHAARRTVCQNHLRQIGIAIANVAEARGAFPTAYLPEAAYRRLLPLLDAAPLYDALNARRDPASWVVPVFACPDDPYVHENMAKIGDASYYYNRGTQIGDNHNGFYKSSKEDTTPRDIRDGLSQTVAMSERLVRPWVTIFRDAASMEAQPRRFFWWTETRYRAGQEALAIDNCRYHRTTVLPQVFGVNMLNYQLGGGYNHLLTPNQPGCYNGPEDFEVDLALSLIPASSLHHGGVNSLLGDGSVRFVSDSIDAAVWQALGTRSGSETAASSF